MNDDEATIVCSPCADGPAWVPASRGRCSQCKTEVWLSDDILDEIGPRVVELVCVPCALDTIPEGTDFQMTRFGRQLESMFGETAGAMFERLRSDRR